MNNKQEKTIRRYVFLATTLLAIASPVTVTGLAAQSQKRFCSKEKNKIEDTDGPDTTPGTPEEEEMIVSFIEATLAALEEEEEEEEGEEEEEHEFSRMKHVLGSHH